MNDKTNKSPSGYYAPTDKLVYEPMTPEQEAELFKRFYAGDPKNLTGDALEARDKLVLNNLRYAADLALRHCTHPDRLQDAISAANYGLIRVLESRRFTPSAGHRFTTYATKFIIHEICRVFRVACSVTFPTGRLPDFPENGVDPEPDTMEDEKGFTPAALDHQILQDALGALEANERAVIELIFFGGLSVKAAAEAHKISRQWATELRDRALIKLRLAMGVPQKVDGDEVSLQEAA